MTTPSPARTWGMIASVALAVEAVGAVHARRTGSPGHGPADYTLSAITRNSLYLRDVEPLRRSLGRTVFLAGWAAVAVHILKEAEKAGLS